MQTPLQKKIMKRILITLIGLFLYKAGMAQTEVKIKDKISLILKAGYTNSTIKGADIGQLSPGGKPGNLGGYYAGLEVNSRLSLHFGLKHEISVFQMGALLKMEDDQGRGFDSKFKTMYLDVSPLSLTFQIKGLQLFAGPYAGILMKAGIQRKNEEGMLYTDKSIFGDAAQEGDYLQKLDTGILGGMAYEFSNGLSLSARYAHGFAAVVEHTDRNEGQWKIFNRSFSFTLGYGF